MSSSGGHHGDGADEEAEEHVDGPRFSRPRTGWEIQEVVATALLIAVAVIAVSAVAAGIASNAGGEGPESTRDAIAQTLLQSTLWAGVTTMFLLIASLGLIWWQVDGWSEALEDAGTGGTGIDHEGGPGRSNEVEEARRHLGRNRLLAKWAGVSLVITSVGALGALVALGLEDEPFPGSVRLQQWFSNGGVVIATLVLGAAGVFAVIRVLKLCDGAFALQS
jgi:hypothetical protein